MTTKIPVELSSTPGIADSSNATAITIDSSENCTFAGTLNGLTLASGGVTGPDSSNFTLNTANSIRINIDSNDSATGESFIVGHNQTAINQSNVLFKVQEDGKVGIGTSTPNRTLSISTGLAKTSTTTAYPFAIQSNESSGNAQLSIHAVGGASAAVRKWYLQTEESGVANAGQIHLQSSGGTVHSPQGIIFGTETTAAHTLDDYEEGSWTPVATTSASNSTINVTVNFAKYIKVGGLVHVSCYLSLDIDAVGTGAAMLTGLPFTATSGQGYNLGIVAHATAVASSATHGISAYVTNGQSNIRMVGVTDAANPSWVAGDPKYIMVDATYHSV